MSSTPGNTRTAAWKLVPKIVLLLIFIASTNPGVIARAHAIGWQAGLVVYAAIWLASIAAIVFVAFFGGWVARIVWSVLWVAAAITGLSYWLITGEYISITSVAMLLNAAAFASDVTGAFSSQLMWSALAGAVGLLAVNIPPYRLAGKNFRWRRTLLVLAPVVPALMVVAIVFARGGEGTNGLPDQFGVPAFVATIGVVHATEGPPPVRQQVVATAGSAKAAKTIIVIMDESVRGDELDINGGKAYSGLMGRDAIAANFGIASSLANCSATSNVTFRYGATREHYLSDIAVNPSMWAYARHAGYQTWYLDAQRSGGKLQNFMTEDERRQIDHFKQIGAGVLPDRKDMDIAGMLRSIIQAPGTADNFVYVNKMGVHFPYEGKYPPADARFHPTLAQNYFGDLSDPKAALPTDATPEERKKFLNSYLNALSWNAGHFFDELLPGLDLQNTIIIYTSDHGQNFHEDGSSGYATHCTDGIASADEGIVPLVVIAGNPALLQQFRGDAKLNFNKASQYNVFPTLLVLMGYNLEEVARTTHVDAPLSAELDPKNQQFLSTYFVRFGQRPVWNPIRRGNSFGAAPASSAQ